MPDGGVPYALAPEVKSIGLVVALAGEGCAVAVADLHPVPVVEICKRTLFFISVFIYVEGQVGLIERRTADGPRTRIVSWAIAHDASEGDLLLHEVRRAAAAAPAELARPDIVAPPSSLHPYIC